MESKAKKSNVVYIYTDGACSGNPGPGGYCAILKYGGYKKTVKGGSPETTNNRMEMMAVIEGLKALNRPCKVIVTTDSQYISNAINKNWLKSWKAKGWIKSDKKPVLNQDLWQELDGLLQKHDVKFVWVKGHDGHEENEECDTIAVAEAAKYK